MNTFRNCQPKQQRTYSNRQPLDLCVQKDLTHTPKERRKERELDLHGF